VIEARSLTKRYGGTAAVDDLSFTIQPGMVTGFLGPNGAGKTTTMRMILGLPQLGRALPTAWYDDAIRWLPGGQFDGAISASRPAVSSHLFSAWGELAVFGAYTAVVLIAGAMLLRRGDA